MMHSMNLEILNRINYQFDKAKDAYMKYEETLLPMIKKT